MIHHPPMMPPTEMSSRAQVYLYAGAARHWVIGVFMLVWPDQFAAAAFIPILNFFDLGVWGLAMVLTAICLGAGATLRQRGLARAGLIASAVVTALLASGLWIGAGAVWLEHGKATPITAILLSALVVKDLAVCTNPMKTPFELGFMIRRAVQLRRPLDG